MMQYIRELFSKIFILIVQITFLFLILSFRIHDAEAEGVSYWAKAAPEGIAESYLSRGPFLSDPTLMKALDCPNDKGPCSGPLNFNTLIEKRVGILTAKLPGNNPFNSPRMAVVTKTVKSDLQEIRFTRSAPDKQLSLNFITDKHSRVQLVGIVNRMDRQFIQSRRESACGEISVIYRFYYNIDDGKQESRLPVTLNLVFPAGKDEADCTTMANRWLKAIMASPKKSSTSVSSMAGLLFQEGAGPLENLIGENIHRLELNMQAYRRPADDDPSDFGTEATYLIRVFRWDPIQKVFVSSELPNQIDRKIFLCGTDDSTAYCDEKKKRRLAFVKLIQDPATVGAIDLGIWNVDSKFLTKRAISVSPGGSHRSENQPYWNSPNPIEQVISDAELQVAIENAKAAKIELKYINTVQDFRTRLNDGTCTGCHQTRAIAGFHFPGSDQPDTNPVNSVLLAGSPHFYGDQPRRLKIIKQIAKGQFPKPGELAPGYSARPEKEFRSALEGTQLIGGWGGACLIEAYRWTSKRKWDCRAGLQCQQVFESDNDPGIGICVPPSRWMEVGDPLQRGKVVTRSFGRDLYKRTYPRPDPEPDIRKRDTRIPDSALPKRPLELENNSYYGGHQEFYWGTRPSEAAECKHHPTILKCHEIRRDFLTGGFPSGSLRLSECRNLDVHNEATCALVASSGFNACIDAIAGVGKKRQHEYTIERCFKYFTSFSGERACSYANPCRDDYICVQPMKYGKTTYQNRLERLMFAPEFKPRNDPDDPNDTEGTYFRDITGRLYDPGAFGQKRPDKVWAESNDKRGICIPPYFVFQFRSDGHPAPPPPEGEPKIKSHFPFIGERKYSPAAQYYQ